MNSMGGGGVDTLVSSSMLRTELCITQVHILMGKPLHCSVQGNKVKAVLEAE